MSAIIPLLQFYLIMVLVFAPIFIAIYFILNKQNRKDR
tara:strand:- start:212 stop:325 length:114 start_codon:yes stop_codon:yes gene_type:complete